MRPLYLKLEGFKGIKAGMGLNKLELNLSTLNGIVAFDAPNGTGKTTIIDNLHPYRLMPYRAGAYSPKGFSYYDHVEEPALKEFVFEMEGKRYKSVLLLSPKRKKQEAYLYVENENGWHPLNPDGKLETYDSLVEDLLGSPELFFTSIFRCQNSKSLSDYTKGELKEILTELLGLEKLKAISDKAKEVKKGLQTIIQIKQQENAALVEKAQRQPEISQQLATAKAEIEALNNQLETLIAEAGTLTQVKSHIEADLAVVAEKMTQVAELQKKRDKKLKRIKDLEKGLINTDEENSLFEKAKQLETLEAKLPEKRQLKEQQQKKLESFIELLKEVELAVKESESIKNQLEGLKKQRQLKVTHLEKELAEALKAVDIISTAPCSNPYDCPIASHVSAKAKLAAAIKKELESLSQPTPEEAALSEKLASLEVANPETYRVTVNALKKRLEATTKEIAVLEREVNSRKEIPVRLANLEADKKVYKELKDELQELEKQLASLEKVDDNELLLKQKQVDAKIQKNKTETTNIQSKLQSAVALTAKLEAELKACEEAATKVSSLSEEINSLKREEADFGLLEKAFGNDGIIALEIDEAGPAISNITNELLSVFGGRFSIRIDTQAAKKSEKNSLKESLEIIVYDTNTNEAKNLKLMSGGERLWIEDAITKAISIVRQQSLGKKYNTIFTDEKDGALDAEKKIAFFQLKQKALEIGGYDTEYCITQTPELLKMANAIIRLNKGGAEIIN